MRKKRTTGYKGIYRKFDLEGNVLPDKWQVRLNSNQKTPDGKRKQIVFTVTGTLEDALDAQARARLVRHDASFVAKDVTLDQLCERFLDHCVATRKRNTTRGYTSIWNSKIRGGIGTRKADSITADELDRFFATLAMRVKPQTANRARTFLMSAYTQGVKWKWVSYNPVKDTTKLKEERYEPPVPTKEEIEAVLKGFVASGEPHYHDFLNIVWQNQLRSGEGCGLLVGDYNPEEKTLYVHQSVGVDTNGIYLEDETKNGVDRVLDLDPMSDSILKRLCEGRPRTEFIFGGIKPWRPSRVTHAETRMRRRICPMCLKMFPNVDICPDCNTDMGIYFRVHDLRADTTTELIDAGFSKEAMVRGGWKNEDEMLRSYHRRKAHRSSGAVEVLAKRFEAGTIADAV